MRKNRNAFTLTEIIVVVVLVGIVAAFGIPNYNDAREKAIETDIVSNLRLIAAAMEIYTIQNNGYPAPALLTAGDINTTLSINVTTSGANLSCGGGGPNQFVCTGIGGNPAFSIRIDEADEGNPVCISATCPSRVAGQSY